MSTTNDSSILPEHMTAHAFQLNAVIVPLVQQDYPRHVHKLGGVFKVVETAAEAKEAVAAGWSLTPVLAAPITEDDRFLGETPATPPKEPKAPKVKHAKKGAPDAD